MKWVKASDRLPNTAGSFHCRDNRGHKVVCHYTPHGHGNSLLKRFPFRMEWLDESIPDNAEKEEFELMAAFKSFVNRVKATVNTNN